MRPRGTPPTPSAASTPIEPVEILLMAANSFAPRRMMEPFPNCRSIWVRAVSAAFNLSLGTLAICLLLAVCHLVIGRQRRRIEVGWTRHSCGEASVGRGFGGVKKGPNRALFCAFWRAILYEL